MQNVLEDEKEMERYKDFMFANTGYNTLYTFTKNLAKEYLDRKEYPFRLGTIFGIPMFDWAHTFNSKEELLSRIKGYAQLLGINSIEVERSSGKVIIEFKEEIKCH